MQHAPSPYANANSISSYVRDAPLKVPGLADLHRMSMLLLAEEAAANAKILVVGAGGGLETLAIAQAQVGWRFTGVDPSAAMLDLARQTVNQVADRIELIEGTVDDAPDGPFDGATCILTLHHVDAAAKLETLRQIHGRLRTGARLVIAGHTAPDPDPVTWMTRSVAFGDRTSIDWEKSAGTGKMMVERLSLLSPLQEEELLCQAGFTGVAMFYQAFSFRGWVAIA